MSRTRFAWAAAVLTAAVALPGWTQETAGLRRLTEAVRAGEPRTGGSLTVIPLFLSVEQEPARCLTLEEGLRQGWLEIVEKDGGQVPEVLISNRSDHTVFIMGGEILSGARQDRIVSRDVLIRPWRKNLPVPVYCVEQGRWHFKTGAFGSEKNLGTWRLRAKAQEARPAAQTEIWEEVAHTNRRAGVSSATEAYQDAYRDERVQRRLRQAEEALSGLPRELPGAVGAVVAVGGAIVSLDLFADPRLFGELWPKILKSSAMAGQEAGGAKRLTRAEAEELLAEIGARTYRSEPALDLGVRLCSTAPPWSVQALAWRDAVLHLAAFPLQEEPAAEKDPSAPRSLDSRNR